MSNKKQTSGAIWRHFVLVMLLVCAGTALAQMPVQLPKQLPQRSTDPYPVQKQLVEDGLHDKKNPGIKMLQEPREGLAGLPQDYPGNRVDWVKALRSGKIDPRTNIMPDTPIRVLNLDILLKNTGELPMVLFPHRQHTEWLDCNNCHEQIFEYKTGTTPGLSMFAVLQGEYCGQCHGAVAFPLTECHRCHSVPRVGVKKE